MRASLLSSTCHASHLMRTLGLLLHRLGTALRRHARWAWNLPQARNEGLLESLSELLHLQWRHTQRFRNFTFFILRFNLVSPSPPYRIFDIRWPTASGLDLLRLVRKVETTKE